VAFSLFAPLYCFLCEEYCVFRDPSVLSPPLLFHSIPLPADKIPFFSASTTPSCVGKSFLSSAFVSSLCCLFSHVASLSPRVGKVSTISRTPFFFFSLPHLLISALRARSCPFLLQLSSFSCLLLFLPGFFSPPSRSSFFRKHR